MKYRILTTLVLVAFTLNAHYAWGQDGDQKTIQVKVKTTNNGKTKVYQRTYSSTEEMEQDEELKELGVNATVTESETMVYTNTEDDKSKEITVDVRAGDNGKVKVRKVIEDEQGKRIIEKEYDNMEELAEDQEMDVEVRSEDEDVEWDADGEEVQITIKKSGEGKSKSTSKRITIEIDEDRSGKKKKQKKVKIIEKEDNPR